MQSITITTGRYRGQTLPVLDISRTTVRAQLNDGGMITLPLDSKTGPYFTEATMRTCSGCLGMSISNAYPPGFCPLGYEVMKMSNHTKSPKGDCPNPKTHAEMIALREEESE